MPSAVADDGLLDPAVRRDRDTPVPEHLHDPRESAPPVGMLPGVVAPPVQPGDLPTSAWIKSDPPGRGRSVFSTAVTVGAVLIALAVVAGIVGLNLRLFQPRGHVLFGTGAGADLCSVTGETRTVTSADPIYFAATLTNRVAGDEAIRLTITRDGEPLFDITEPPNGTAFECYGSREPYGPYEPGVYVFEVTHDGMVEASGTLTVT